jgi:hypothetical protein
MKALSTAILTMFAVLALRSGLYAAPTVECGAKVATQFNLEPASNAVPQQLENVDFIPNRVALNRDLVVAGASDARGLAPGGPKWDGSLSGYYVHRSTSLDCSPQLEGGLPTITALGKKFLGDGGTVIAADPARDAFFAADLRFDLTDSLSGIGLFRASSTTLLNPTLCPNGTHTAAQATACWTKTAPVLIGQAASAGGNASQDFPGVTVDERPSNAGVGAGDVYVAFGSGSVMTLTACTGTTLSCSAPLTISDSSDPAGPVDARVEVRPDGIITVTYLDMSFGSATDTIKFVSCKPAGAPKTPVCAAPSVVVTENQAVGPSFFGQSLSGMNQLVITFPKHANRLEADGKTVTTFVVWDRCKAFFNLVQQQSGLQTCLDADVVMSTSTDGKTWSAAMPVNAGKGHQFFPSIALDESTGIVNIAYYDTGIDPFDNRMRVSLNQIAPGGTKVGALVHVTSTSAPWNADPSNNPFALFDFDLHFGMKARGMGSAGHSRVYVSFTSTADRPGTYNGLPVPEQNNNLQKLIY